MVLLCPVHGGENRMVEELAQSNSKVLRSEPQREKRQPELLSMWDRLTAPRQVRDGEEGVSSWRTGAGGGSLGLTCLCQCVSRASHAENPWSHCFCFSHINPDKVGIHPLSLDVGVTSTLLQARTPWWWTRGHWAPGSQLLHNLEQVTRPLWAPT